MSASQDNVNTQPNRPEDEPLLGSARRSQNDDDGILRNLYTGTAALAQAGTLILAALIWSTIFSHKLIFFSAHPLLNSTAILLQIQATLILQPTTKSTPRHKAVGTQIHYSLQILSVISFVSAAAVIETNKGADPSHHLISLHGILGLTTYLLIVLQASSGIVQYFIPKQILGSVDAGKSLYRYHRMLGYLLLGLELITVAAATGTSYNIEILHLRIWPVLVAALVVVAGVAARIRTVKLRAPPVANQSH